MRIGEVARQTGLAASRIRYYEANDLIPPAKRSKNGYRDYPESIVETLRLIDRAQELGFSLAEIAGILSRADDGRPSKGDILEALRSRLIAIDLHLQEVTQRRERICGFIAKIENECLAPEKTRRSGKIAQNRDVRSSVRQS
jgi:DNA-binding transcriptional MerR regulator